MHGIIPARLCSNKSQHCARVLATSRWIPLPFPRPRAKAKLPLHLKEFVRVLNECGVAQNAEQHLQSPMPCTNQHCVHMNIAHTHGTEDCKNKYPRFGSPGKGKGIGGKGKGKDGKGSKGGKGMGKGKGKGKGKGHPPGLGLQLPLQASNSSTSSSASKPNTNLADVTCYFCHQKGHYKSQCPKWLALRSSSGAQVVRSGGW